MDDNPDLDTFLNPQAWALIPKPYIRRSVAEARMYDEMRRNEEAQEALEIALEETR